MSTLDYITGSIEEGGGNGDDDKNEPSSSAPDEVDEEEGPKDESADKKGKKKKKKKKDDSGRIGGYKPYKDKPSTKKKKKSKKKKEEEEEDMLKFDDAEKGSTGSSSSGSNIMVSDSEPDDDSSEDSSDDDSSDDSSSEEEEDSDEDSSLESIESSSSEESDRRGRKGSRKKSGKKAKQQKKKKRKSSAAAPAAAVFGRLFSSFRRKKDMPTVEECKPMKLSTRPGDEQADQDRTYSGRSYGDWARIEERVDYDPDVVENAASHIRMEHTMRRKALRRKICLILLSILVVIGVILASIFDYNDLVKIEKWFPGFGVEDVAAWENKNHNPTTLPGVPFDTGVNVEGLCAMGNVVTMEGYFACRDVCDSAFCCFLSPWEKHTCAIQFADQCHRFTNSCSILDRVVKPRRPGDGQDDIRGGGLRDDALPVPDATLPALCSSAAVKKSGGLEKCHEACEPGKCCFASTASEPIDDCYMDNKYVCSAYNPCITATAFQGGAVSGAADQQPDVPVDPNAPPVIHSKNFQFYRRKLVLEQACSKRGIAVSDTCEKYCKGYQCCFGLPFEGQQGDCHDQSKCEEMDACANVFT